MKTINYFNYFFVSIPIFFCLMAIINIGFLSYAMLSTILTGIFQIVIGLKMYVHEPHDKNLQTYFASVLLFFVSLIIICKMGLYDLLNYILFGIPPVIAIYLSLIIYEKAYQ
ncbi:MULTISPECIES: hypothetical protein [Flavobacterium]|uniref:Uncharacterized protein n=3 Tax=Flavobacterium TaxID=237 RepID=A0A6V6Z1Y3_9FLAO|nr:MULTISPECIES: hypothetical protein [Flavobacterium]CAD0005686.1 hypothetical protein FLAT13_02901 [Flavobacterium salmonis]